MTAALLSELETAGITLTRNGDRLHYRTPPGVSLGPFREQIAANKPRLIRELLRQEIQATVTVDPSQFHRERHDELWRQWRALPDSDAQAAELLPQVEAGWDWLAAHPDHPEHEAFFERWLDKLHVYEQTLCHTHTEGTGPVEASIPPVNWTGAAPGGCAVPHACTTLGPCTEFTRHGRCWKESE